MNKTIKKLENNVIRALTDACEKAKVDIYGFDWLTHTADYANFPGSLHIRCIFDTDASLAAAITSENDNRLIKLIHGALLKGGILLKNPKRHITFDTEQACEREHLGNWKNRLHKKH